MNQLLLDLYDCPGDVRRWPAFLDGVCRQVRVRSAIIQVLGRESGQFRSQWVRGDSQSESQRDLHAPYVADETNPRLQCDPGPQLHARKMFLRDSDFFRRGNADLKRFQSRLGEIGLGKFMGVGVPVDSGCFLVLVLHRAVEDALEFSAAEESLMSDLLPHVKQSFLLAQRIESANRAALDLQAGVNRMNCGMILCDREARHFWSNRAARRILLKADRIWISGERLTSTTAEVTRTLRRLIAEAGIGVAPDEVPPSSRYLQLDGAGGTESLQVRVLPAGRGDSCYPAGACGAANRVMLLLSEPHARPVLPADVVARLFALSPAEARLAVQICQGVTLGEFAAAHGVTVGTARFQLKQVLAKTRSNKQSDLVRLICSSVLGQTIQGEAYQPAM